jgi:hypothetical protein
MPAEHFSTKRGTSPESYGVNVTATAIIDSMRTDEVPSEMKSLVQLLAEFAVSSPASQVIG